MIISDKIGQFANSSIILIFEKYLEFTLTRKKKTKCEKRRTTNLVAFQHS